MAKFTTFADNCLDAYLDTGASGTQARTATRTRTDPAATIHSVHGLAKPRERRG